MVKSKNPPRNATAELVNFHFSTSPPVSQQQQQQNRTGSGSGSSKHNRRNRNNDPARQNTNIRPNQQQQRRQYQRNKEDRASARKKASGKMFFLHSSPDHAFVISRKPYHHHCAEQQQQQQQAASLSSYSFLGSDEAVSWEVVRSVKYFASAAHQREACPICLDTFTCARISKCGHVFCLSCLLHHVQSTAMNQPYANGPKCPCCASLLHMQDLRPVEIISVIPPPAAGLHHHHQTTTIRFTKLHRCTKTSCSAPFIPLPDYPRRSSPYAAPCQTDPDALFCRFNYVDMQVFSRLLQQNLAELQASHVYSDVEAICKALAVETVQKEIQTAVQEQDEEQVFVERFQQATAGVYQAQPAHLLAASYYHAEESLTAAIAAGAKGASDSPSGSPSKDAVIPNSNDDSASAVTDYDIETTAGEEAILLPSKQLVSRHIHDDRDGDDDEHEHGGDEEKTRLRGDFSGGSEISPPNSPMGRSRRRSRGDSITSHDTKSTDGGSGRQHQLLAGGSMYLGEDESAFYQTDDGRLCFLSGFNMNCMCAEFTPQLPDDVSVLLDENLSIYQRRKLSPLPDIVEGRVLEVEHVHLTSELRQRLRFLSHLPLYLDICFVEISLGNNLSNKTKKAFSKEFNKRKQARASKINAEKRADARTRKIEEERINERKASMQHIDPNDEFFMPTAEADPIANLTGDAFGPSISQQRLYGDANVVASGATPPRSPVFSFAAVTRSGAFPSLSSLESAFPALGSTETATRKAPTPAPWGRSLKSAQEHVAATSSGTAASASTTAALPQEGTKRKGKKVLLFSTGSHRGGM